MGISLAVRAASGGDVRLLAQMNKRLIEDEGSRNPMSTPELEQRMRDWLDCGWNADLFMESRAMPDGQLDEGESVVGYAVYQPRRDEYDQDEAVIYLRQFFIDRPYRDKGLGTLALRDLVGSRFPDRCTVVVDVLAVHPRGLRFWERVGFRPYVTTLKLKTGTK
jgi:GNAT superfamily N-acetyltransferase